MTTEKDQLIKKILSEQKDRLVHFLECCRVGETAQLGEFLSHCVQVEVKENAEPVKPPDVLERWALGNPRCPDEEFGAVPAESGVRECDA